MNPIIDRWKGRTVACFASGPSLTAEDCAAVRSVGWPAIVTNTTWQMAPWADALFAFDSRWWAHYHAEVARAFRGAMFTCAPGRRFEGVHSLHGAEWFRHYHNSGASAISLAISAGAARIVLLGYDCQRTGGKLHWHGDHPSMLGNARTLHKWPFHFKQVAKLAASKGVEVLNASRQTALTHFPRVVLGDLVAAELRVAA